MRDALRSTGRWLHASWVLPLVLLALPNCMLNSEGLASGDDHFQPGDPPRFEAVMCEIPKVLPEGASDCASPMEQGFGIRMASAATALVEGQNSSLGLDFSQAAFDKCGGPTKTEFHGTFPDGYRVCLNCAQQIPALYADANAVCVAKCIDLTHQAGIPPPEGVNSFCAAKARVATNFNQICYTGACSEGGTPLDPFDDPRRIQEPVKWTDTLGGATFVENDLTKPLPAPGNGVVDDGTFNAGAVSEQQILRGDAWVEFEAMENDKSHIIGIAPAGPHTDPSHLDIGFALSLNFDGNVYVLEHGQDYVSPILAQYNAGDRFRVRIKENTDGSASVTYTRLDCSTNPCAELALATQNLGPNPGYPLQISTAFREPGATLKNVRLVYIQPLP